MTIREDVPELLAVTARHQQRRITHPSKIGDFILAMGEHAADAIIAVGLDGFTLVAETFFRD